MKGTAAFSDCGLYRWTLSRVWDELLPQALVCGANPSIANAERMDPTMHQIVKLLRPLGYGGYIMVNASPYIATDPSAHEAWRRFMSQAYPDEFLRITDANVAGIARAAAVTAVSIAAWGNLAKPAEALLKALAGGRPLMCWGETLSAQPKHPLARGKSRIPPGTPLRVWDGGPW